MARAVKSFSYDTGEDRELARQIDALPHGELSNVIREALRQYWRLERTTATLDDVYQVVKRIERKLSEGVIVGSVAPTPEADDTGDAPGTDEAAANLAGWM